MRERESEHPNVNALLPWYANETLDAGEAERVEAHLAGCADCRGELVLWRAVGAAVISEDASSGAEPDAPEGWRFDPARLERLMARIDTEEAGDEGLARAAGRGEAALGSRLRAWWAAATTVPRWAVAAQGLAVAGLASLLLLGPAGEPALFETRSLPGTSAATLGGPRLVVAFSESATEGELRALLSEVGATLVGGPSALGAYEIVLPAEASVPEVLARLRGSDVVRLAEPDSSALP